MADEIQGGNEETASSSSLQEPTRAELTELVRAIKFAKPDASMRGVHREIAQDLSLKSGFEFLSDVKLNDVRRVWKKAVTSATAQQQEQHPSEESDVMKLYTVGDGNVRMLAKEYSQQAATEAAEASLRQQKQDQLEMAKYVHVFLDVPMDRSGNRPHQALISFRENDGSSTQNKESSVSIDERGEIVKIQVSHAPGDDDALYPMLLYNHDRSMKTFIHHDPKDDGYDRIRKRVIKHGTGGALSSSGGLKAYFYCRLTKQKKGPNVISIDVSSRAPPQNW